MTVLELLLSDSLRALPVFLASLVGSYVVIERFLVVRALRREAVGLLRRLRSLGDGEGASDPQTFLASTEGRAAAVFGHAIGRSDLGTSEVVHLTESAWADEVDRLERPLSIGVIAAVAAGLSGLLPFLFDLLELTTGAGDPEAGVFLPSAAAVVSAFLGCTVAGMLVLGLFIARREMQKLRASARALIPEFVHMLHDTVRDAGRPMEGQARNILSEVMPGEDEFFRPKAPVGMG